MSHHAQLKQNIELVRFRIGQPISEGEALPARVFFACSG